LLTNGRTHSIWARTSWLASRNLNPACST
jgi:hypothetical protein